MCVHWEEFLQLVYLCYASFFILTFLLLHPHYKRQAGTLVSR